LTGAAREALLGATDTLPSLQQGRTSVLPDGTRLHDEQIITLTARAGSPGATSWSGPRRPSTPKSKASAAMSLASLKAQLVAAPAFDNPAAVEPEASSAFEQAIAGARKPLDVLVAEDNEINALLTRAMLTRLGHQPAVVESGAAALDRWRAACDSGLPYDLILMDMQMPGMDGLEVARRIRAAETERGAGRTPIIALAANAFAEDREACLAAGMDGFLVKPLDRERLAAALAEVAGRAAIAA